MLKMLMTAPLGLALLAGMAITSAPLSGSAIAKDANKYVCMTDDGYGRYRPCSAGYKAQNPSWRAGDTCFTDEGNGRYRPCSAGYKAKNKK